MSTDASSPARTVESPTGTLRGSLTSMAAQRSFIILAFFLYEEFFIRRAFSGEDWLRIPLWDIRWADNSTSIVLLECLYLGASVLACFRRFVIPGCLLAGTASILLVLFDLTYRLQFAFLPGGALIALGLSEILARTGDPKRRIDLPLVLLLGSVYGFASFHKLWNFPWMRTSLPSDVFNVPGGAMAAFSTSPDNVVLHLVAWTVVPYEALLAVLTLSRRWLKLRLGCVGLFHWLLVVLVPSIWSVSLYMLCLHLHLASLQRPSVRQRMFSERNWVGFAVAEGFFVAAKVAAPSIPGPVGTVVGAVAFANLVLFPVIFLFGTFRRADREPVSAPPVRLRGPTGVAVVAFGAMLVAFGFSPLLLEKKYSVRALGWSMFAGGEYRDGSYYVLRTPASACFSHPVVYGMIFRQVDGEQFQYVSFCRSDLERLKRFLERRKCGGPPLQVMAAHF